MCSHIEIDAGKLNPKWNKTYGVGVGGTNWNGAINDGRLRGGMPYFCPKGWARFALNVGSDKEFKNRY